MPSVLFETGYISNINDATFLASTDGQQRVASTVRKAVEVHLAMWAVGRLGSRQAGQSRVSCGWNDIPSLDDLLRWQRRLGFHDKAIEDGGDDLTQLSLSHVLTLTLLHCPFESLRPDAELTTLFTKGRTWPHLPILIQLRTRNF